MDWQFTPQMRLTSRYTRYQVEILHIVTGGAPNHPSTGRVDERIANQFFADFNQVLNQREA